MVVLQDKALTHACADADFDIPSVEELVGTISAKVQIKEYFESLEALQKKASLYLGTIHIARARGTGTFSWCWDMFTTRRRAEVKGPGFVPRSHIQELKGMHIDAFQELLTILQYSSKRGADDKFKFKGIECYVEKDGMELPLGTKYFCVKSDEPLPRVKTTKRSRQEDQEGKCTHNTSYTLVECFGMLYHPIDAHDMCRSRRSFKDARPTEPDHNTGEFPESQRVQL